MTSPPAHFPEHIAPSVARQCFLQGSVGLMGLRLNPRGAHQRGCETAQVRIRALGPKSVEPTRPTSRFTLDGPIVAGKVAQFHRQA